jgi:hypothetical protein
VKQLRQGTLAKQEDALFLSVPVILLVSPQTLFYDLGIAVVALARIIPALNFRYLVRVALAFILFVVVALLRSEIEFPVYCLISVGIPCLLAFMNEIAVDKTTEAVDE